MKEKLRRQIEMLFEETSVTKKSIELKEELYANSVERFEDLTKDGMSEEDAYKLVINSMGDIQGLLDSIAKEESADQNEELRKKYALLKAVAAAMYVLALVAFLGIMFATADGIMALVAAATICIIPVGITVYAANMSFLYKKPTGTVVDDFREWQSGKGNKKEIKKAISSIVWLITLILYFIVSFATQAWYITWVLFLVAICIDTIVGLLFNIKGN